jgi:hypothetical protein
MTQGALIVLIAAVGLVLILIPVIAVNRARIQSLSGDFPDAVIFVGNRNTDLVTALPALTVGRNPGNPGDALGYQFGVVIDSIGLSLWKGIQTTKEILRVPWSNIVGVEVGQISDSNRTSTGIVFRTKTDSLELSLPISLVSARIFPSYARRPEVEAIVEKIRLLAPATKSSSVGTAATRTETSTAAMRKIATLPGISAYAFGKALLVSYWIYGAIATTYVATRVLSLLSVEISIPGFVWFSLIMGLAVPALVVFIALFLRKARETAAGYTTMQAGDLNLDQVDSATGVVVREAGRPYLSKAELKAARERAHMFAKP